MRSECKVACSVLAVVVGLLAWSSIGAAQRQAGAGQGRGASTAAQTTPAPVRISVATTHVKPDMIGVYEDLIKNEANPALKKVGVPYRWTFAEFIAGQNYTMVSVQPVPNFAQYDQGPILTRALGADGAANYNAKLRSTIVSTETKILTVQRPMSINSASTTPPTYLQVQRILVAPGKAQ